MIPAALTIRWCDELRAWCDVMRTDRNGSPVLLRAGEPAREHQWERALDDGAPAPLASPSKETVEDGLVISVDRRCEDLSRVLAEALGRRHSAVDGPEEIAADPPGAASLILVGLADRFPYRVRRALLESLTLDWGLFTASDLPGLAAHVTRRLHLRQPRGLGTLTIDGIAGTLTEDAITIPLVESGAVQLAQLSEALAKPRALAILRGHGRGSHGQLPGLVLCGLIGEAERDDAGRVVQDGCRRNARGLHCKLAGGEFPDALPFGVLPAPLVALFTCASATLPGDLFPTRSSAALAAIEAGAAGVLATNEVFFCPEEICSRMLQAASEGLTLGAIARRLNDWQTVFHGHRPFIVFGDPTLRLPKGGSTGARPESPPPFTTESPDPSLLAAIQRWHALHARCADVRSVIWAIRTQYASPLEGTPEFRADLERVESLLGTIEGQLLSVLEVADNAGRRHGWVAVLNPRHGHIESALRAWEEAFVDLAIRHLFVGSDAHPLLVAHRRRTEAAGPACDYCGAITRRVTAHGDPPAGRTDCPLCSAHQAWSPGGGPIEARWQRCARPGDRVPVIFELPWSGDSGLRTRSVSAVIFGGDPVVPRNQPAIERQGKLHALTLEIPPAAAPKSHALQIASAHDLCLSFYRRIISVL